MQESQPIFVQAQQVQDGGVQIANVHGIFDDVVRVVIGPAIFKDRLHAAGHPDRKTPAMMIAAGAGNRTRMFPVANGVNYRPWWSANSKWLHWRCTPMALTGTRCHRAHWNLPS